MELAQIAIHLKLSTTPDPPLCWAASYTPHLAYPTIPDESRRPTLAYPTLSLVPYHLAVATTSSMDLISVAPSHDWKHQSGSC